MKAAVIDRYGSPEVLEYRDVQMPSPSGDRLLVKVYASSVNPVDWKIRRGNLQLLSGYNFPLVLGSDFAGVVEAVGDRVTQFQPGDKVYGAVNPLSGGAYTEYLTVPESSLALKPDKMSFEEAAAVPVAGITSFQALLNIGQIRPGYKVLINGASGGVGTFAVQIAKAMSAEVIGVCSTKNLELVQTLGSDRVIDYTQQDFTQETREYDLIFDAVGKRSLANCQGTLKPGGMYISTLPTLENLAQTVLTTLFPYKQARMVLAQPNTRDLEALQNWIEADKVYAVIDRVYPLAEIAKAHEYSEEEHAVGKIILTHHSDSSSS